MKELGNTLGIQSFCFRGFKTHEQVIAGLKDCGVAAVELCGVHVDFGDADSFGPTIEQYRAAGIEIVSIGVQSFTGDEAKERLFFEFVKQAGARYMSVNFQPDTSPASWRTAEKLAEEYDVRLAIHNHGGRHWLGSSAMLQHVFNNTSERIGLCLDTAWALDSNEDPLEMVKTFADRLYGLHIKDFVFDRARKPEDVVVGSGNLDLSALFAAMDEAGFGGYAVLEYEGDVDNPVPALQQCVQAVRDALA